LTVRIVWGVLGWGMVIAVVIAGSDFLGWIRYLLAMIGIE
jgi:hypothetical protein